MAVDCHLEKLIVLRVAASRKGFPNFYCETDCLYRVEKCFSPWFGKILVKLVTLQNLCKFYPCLRRNDEQSLSYYFV